MSANITAQSVVRRLDIVSDVDNALTDEEVGQPHKLARALLQIQRDVRKLLGLWRPRRIDFEDQAVDGTGATLYRFPHGFAGRVRYWVVEWSGAAAPNLQKDEATDANTLVLTSTSAGTATVRVEEAG